MDTLTTTKSPKEKEEGNNLVLSYMTLRNFIGWAGFILPAYLIIFTIISPDSDLPVQGSISDYYYTSSGDVFVLLLCMCSIFLLTYQGYNWKEKLLGYLAAIGGLGVAFDPTKDKGTCHLSVHTHTGDERHIIKLFGTEIHFLFAGLFLICLAIIAIKYFPKTNPGEVVQKGSKKAKRNFIYKLCGWIMLGSVAACIIHEAAYDYIHPLIGKFPFIFTCETIALFAFSFSWLTKGQTLYPDGEHYMITGLKMAKQAFKKDNQQKIDLK